MAMHRFMNHISHMISPCDLFIDIITDIRIMDFIYTSDYIMWYSVKRHQYVTVCMYKCRKPLHPLRHHNHVRLTVVVLVGIYTFIWMCSRTVSYEQHESLHDSLLWLYCAVKYQKVTDLLYYWLRRYKIDKKKPCHFCVMWSEQVCSVRFVCDNLLILICFAINLVNIVWADVFCGISLLPGYHSAILLAVLLT